MALEKVITQDKIEIVGEFKAVQVRTKTAITDDGLEISSAYSRKVITAGQDYSGESSEVQAICSLVHTPEVVAAFQAAVES
jgi:shikimate kinase|tara:strand:+ start:46 stop:288 length:243 start_codon:yes stop_codon:yes gene_type:complete